VITAELRRAILAAAGQLHSGPAQSGLLGADPRLVPGLAPGSYVSSLPFRLGPDPRAQAAALAARLAAESWIAGTEVTGPGYLTVTVTHDTLAGLAVRIPDAGPACATSDALRDVPVPVRRPATEPGWPRARAALAAELTVRLAAAAGAPFDPERPTISPSSSPPPDFPTGAHPAPSATPPPPAPPDETGPAVPATAPPPAPSGQADPVVSAIAYAGADAVRFALARMPPGGPPPDPRIIARHVLANPAYAVRYAHAAAAAVLRWAAALGTRPAGFRPRLLAGPEELALLDALSWLPERVAMAARRGRPDEFAGYLEELAAQTIDTMSTTGFTKVSDISSERLWLADAARTGLAACLGLLGISAPSRL
jgi:arginyl-tRNA synthetase